MSPTPAPADARHGRLTRRSVLSTAWAGYVLTLLLAALLGPPLAAAVFETSLASALSQTALVVGVGYLAGAALLLRPR
jgi:hypothetical protein